MHPMVLGLRNLPTVFHQRRSDCLFSRYVLRLSRSAPPSELARVVPVYRTRGYYGRPRCIGHLSFLERPCGRRRLSDLATGGFFWHRISQSRCGSICCADRSYCSCVFHFDRVDVRRARPSAWPSLRRLCQPCPRLPPEYRREASGYRWIFCAFLCTGSADSLVPDLLQRCCLPTLSGKGPYVVACRDAGDVTNHYRRAPRLARP